MPSGESFTGNVLITSNASISAVDFVSVQGSACILHSRHRYISTELSFTTVLSPIVIKKYAVYYYYGLQHWFSEEQYFY